MSPALPLLAALVLAGPLFAGRRHAPVGRAWGVVGLAGMALLSPALSLPGGIPSPAASLGEHPPWQGLLDPAHGNPNLRDIHHQIEPWLLFLRDEWRAGRPAFWNPFQGAGAPFWANGQSAPLFPLHGLFVLLPPSLGFVLLPWLRFLIAGLGAWALARELDVGEEGALLAGLVFPLSGMLVSMLLFPMANSLAVVPWVLWATERLVTGRSAGALLAGLAGLQLVGGHPETSVHTGMLALVWVVARVSTRGRGEDVARRPLRGTFVAAASGTSSDMGDTPGRPTLHRLALRFAAAWLLAGALAAAALVPLAFYVFESTKYLEFHQGARPPVVVVFREMLRLVLPQAYGHPAEGTWFGPFNYAATASYAGALALPLAAAGLARTRRSGRFLALVAVGLFSLLVAYHLPGLWDLVARVPLLGRVAQHRLIFGLELTLAVAAGAGLDRLLAGRGRGVVAGAAAVLGLLGAAWSLFAEDWRRHGLTGEQAAWTAWAALAALLAVAALALPRRRRGFLALLLPALLAGDLLAAHGGILRALPVEKLYPVTPAVDFLAERPGRVVGAGYALHPNAAMVYRLYDLRVDDPLKLARFERLYRQAAPADPVYFRPIERWQAPVLDRLGVRWVMTGPGDPPAAPGWRLAYDGPDARVWERSGALPMVRGEGVAGLEVLDRQPGRWLLAVEALPGAELTVAETWDPGWRVRVGGRAVPVPEGELLRLALPKGSHRVELRYVPPGWWVGVGVSLAAVVLWLWWTKWTWWARWTGDRSRRAAVP